MTRGTAWRGKLAATKTKAEEKFLSAQADTFAGAKAKQKSACCVWMTYGVAGVQGEADEV